ncbi:MAG: HEAT repeat domain-containing protein [Planctomycetes bacterium]|nr:HEAT repeat domain-containing protein [Planctomycetota bacterium]
MIRNLVPTLIAGILAGVIAAQSSNAQGDAPRSDTSRPDAKPPVFWEPSIADALTRATRLGRPVLIAVLDPGEAASRYYLDEVYPSLLVHPVMRELVCVVGSNEPTAPLTEGPRKGMSAVFQTVSSQSALAVAKDVEQRYLGEQVKKAPIHLVLNGGGHLIATKTGKLKRSEFVRFLTKTLDDQDPGWQGTIDPLAMKQGGDKQQGAAIPFAGLFGDDQNAARKAIESLLDATDKTLVARLYPQIPSPSTRARVFEAARKRNGDRSWLEAVLELGIADKDPEVRAQAAVTAEEVRTPGLASKLLKAWEEERDDIARDELLRAAAACGRGDADVWDALGQAVKDKSDRSRANAYVALARFGDADDKLASRSVDVLMRRGLRERDDRTRNASIWALAELRSRRARKDIEKLAKKERGPVKRFFEKALDRIDGKDVEGWGDSRRFFASETIRR